MNKLILLGIFMGCLFLMAYRYDKKKKILFFGDSITELGLEPGGYIRVIDSLIHRAGLTDTYELIGAGIGGNKVYDLYLRTEQDVLSKNPDIVVIFVGVNDVWHKSSFGTGTDYDKFGQFYTAIVNKLKAAGIKVIVCTPAVIGERTDYSNPQDGDLNSYSNWIRQYSTANAIPLVDLRMVFHNYALQHNPDNRDSKILTTDRVHLNDKGNLLVAEEMWKAIAAMNAR